MATDARAALALSRFDELRFGNEILCETCSRDAIVLAGPDDLLDTSNAAAMFLLESLLSERSGA